MSTAEKRIFNRRSYFGDIALLDERGRAWLTVPGDNISSNGVALKTAIPFPRGLRLFLKIALADGLPPFVVHGEVLRRIERRSGETRVLTGIGVRFVHLSAREVVRLERFVRAG